MFQNLKQLQQVLDVHWYLKYVGAAVVASCCMCAVFFKMEPSKKLALDFAFCIGVNTLLIIILPSLHVMFKVKAMRLDMAKFMVSNLLPFWAFSTFLCLFGLSYFKRREKSKRDKLAKNGDGNPANYSKIDSDLKERARKYGDDAITASIDSRTTKTSSSSSSLTSVPLSNRGGELRTPRA